ncbi:AraC-like ligand binding domain-containing protein [Chryseobacterium oranimense]|uniref:AraC-like ligand binding domain-containing protein n=1 Tax=Chryseobacterium oranimense TaxID=421058 RepID=A0A1M5R242_9FLAO|nr:AraC family transcriptional regulator [Chryseobacterium oranimense]CEJ69258.1 HTH-type transcriptional activator RhaS [Chryseobacterium oranimense G311]SHH20495.1 AraC-like ligand binding domain-containing protein [Chryseobacterium oranimense]
MKARETLEEFYDLHGREHDQYAQCNVYRREDFECSKSLKPVYRRDFYKISMMCEGTGILSYADKFIRIDRPSIVFLNPLIPYSWEPESSVQTGYFCLFTEEFVSQELKNESLSQSPLFKAGGDHVFFPDENSVRLLKNLYENMLKEVHSDYDNKYSLLRNYIQIIMHEAMKMQPPQTYGQHSNAAERISTLFLELLEHQFPVSQNNIILLKNANEFATQLNIHTNHLNKALKETTGKTTSEWINGRIIKEAKSLLQFSNRSVSEIAYSLGFEHSSNFIISFKKKTGDSPNQFRKRILSKS